MIKRDFKPFGKVSSLTLGGGGIGGSWGTTKRAEAIATVNLALEMGIDHFDVAPLYGKGEAEKVLGKALSGKDPSNLHFTTKCLLGDIPNEQIFDRLETSLARSMRNIGVERIDLFLLHSQLILDGTEELFRFNEFKAQLTTPISAYFDAVIPAFERLKEEGKIAHWGITGLGEQAAVIEAINHQAAPAAVQCVVNVLNSAGGLNCAAEDFDPRAILSACREQQVPVLAIRAVQAGALTGSMDRELEDTDPDQADYKRAHRFRELASEWKESPASLAHRYALSIAGVSSVILGTKNRPELQDCLRAEQTGGLAPEELEALESLFSGD